MTIMVSLDRNWGGFYVKRGFTTRICLGFLALTLIPIREDYLLGMAFAEEERLLDAAERAGVMFAGCDTSDLLADEIVELRRQLAEAEVAE